MRRWPASYRVQSDVEVVPVSLARTTTSMGSGSHFSTMDTLGSGTATMCDATMSPSSSNHHAESWLRIWPRCGTRPSTRSNADSRSVATSARRSPRSITSRTLPRRSGPSSAATSAEMPEKARSSGARAVIGPRPRTPRRGLILAPPGVPRAAASPRCDPRGGASAQRWHRSGRTSRRCRGPIRWGWPGRPLPRCGLHRPRCPRPGTGRRCVPDSCSAVAASGSVTANLPSP